MRNSRTTFSLFLLMILFSACSANKHVREAREAELPALKLAYKAEIIEIKDIRLGKSAGDIQLPIMSFPGQNKRGTPALTDEHKKIIEDLIRNNNSASGIPVRAIVTLVECYKEFSANMIHEKERAYAEVKISLVDPNTGKPFVQCQSQGDFYVTSADAKTTRIETIYQVALRNAIYTCLQSIDKQSRNKSDSGK